ncbi:hypothetical protein KFZ58_08755 [Virgibacillus sp. NKC19-16]|uniref:hypothetical protein n=1 Tax=Virgibacillus salidurans TaxID=2831673 RepID=UPI001F26920B|nr:hypothetical protein [Virgibacillus sp. NKC19-16]UJL47921.1 hypothetical protein KFZ58_08755 [Virgibacillus sp. NKC19-16]
MSVHQVALNRSTNMNHTQQVLRSGQIIQGKIVKLYPDNKAQLQLGSQRMVAQLEAALSTGEKYHFQVRTKDNAIHLKVLGEQLKNRTQENVTQLLHQLGLKVSKANTAFVQTLIHENIPFDKNQLLQAFQLLNSSQNKEHTQEILKNMIADKLPITDSIKQALSMKNTYGFSEQMKALLQALQQDTNQTQLKNRLNQMVEHLLSNQDKAFMLASPRDQLLTTINQTLLFTGLTYENQLLNANIQQQSVTIKAMLMQLLHEGDGALHGRPQQLLHFINGMQLQSVNEFHNYLKAHLVIPGARLGIANDLELDFEGGKTESGEINPDYCRILFYLDLSNLNKTIIDMNIQKRSVAVTIFNDFETIQEHFVSLKPMLIDGLGKLDYHLSSISFKALQQLDEPKRSASHTYAEPFNQGVDYRI